MATILITGISGLVGTALSQYLQKQGHTIKGLSRSAGSKNGIQIYKWNIDSGEIDELAFKDVTHIVHLAGEGIADKRWTEERKKAIMDSRTKSTELVIKTIEKLKLPIQGFAGASAIGAYGLKTSEHIYTETDRETDDFFGKTCQLWEDSYLPLSKLNIRTCILRIGIVLSARGGAYVKMKTPVKFGIGSALGSGKQYMPFVHIDDVVGAFEKALLDETMKGIYNLVGSEHVTNYQFNKALSRSIQKPFFMPAVPAFILKLLLGEMHLMVTTGSRVSNEKLLNSGYNLKFPTLEAALAQLAKAS